MRRNICEFLEFVLSRNIYNYLRVQQKSKWFQKFVICSFNFANAKVTKFTILLIDSHYTLYSSS